MCLEITDATNPIISLSYPDLLGARETDDGVLISREDSGGLMERALSPTSETTPDNISIQKIKSLLDNDSNSFASQCGFWHNARHKPTIRHCFANVYQLE
jgi:hypothetical protein